MRATVSLRRAAGVKASLPTGRCLSATPMLLSLLAGMGNATAQGAEGVVFAGRVIDNWWGNPVEGAVVRLEETRRPDGSQIFGITDAGGDFRIPRVPLGPSRVSVSRLGYADLFQVLDIQADQFIDVVMIPKPVVLEGIDVYVDRLESRLRGVPYLTDRYVETELRSSPDLNLAEFLDSRAGFEFVPCFEDNSGAGLFRQARNCLRLRGAMPRRPSIYIDDAPAFGGVPELAGFPATQIYRVEVIRGCGQIRVYTRAYVEGVVTTPRPLIPILC